MRTSEEIETFLIELALPFERLDDGIWVITNDDDHGENLVVYRTDKVLSFRVKLFELPDQVPIRLLRTLLELNASTMVHGAFGIEGSSVVLVAALELENLDLNEFQAIVDSFALTLGAHHDELSEFLNN